MQSDELKCLVHNNGNIIGFCLNKQCKNSRPCCLKCQREFHSGHFNEIMEYDELEKLLEKNQQQMEQVLFYISELESVIQIIRISYQYLRQTSDLNRVQALHDKIDIVLKTDEAKFKQLSLDFKDLLKQIGMFAENIFDFKMNQYIIRENIDKLNEVRQLVKQNGCNKSLKMLENFVVSKKQQSSLTKIQSLIFKLYQSLGVIEEKINYLNSIFFVKIMQRNILFSVNLNDNYHKLQYFYQYMQQENLRCSIHQQRNIIGFCFNKQCQNVRPCCLQCQKEFHSMHLFDIYEQEDVQQLLKNNYKTREQVLYQITEIESLIKVVKLSFQSLLGNPDLNNIQSIHQQIENALKTDQDKINLLTSAFQGVMRQIARYAEDIFSFKMDNFEIKENIDKFNQVKQLVQKEGCNESLKVLENIILSQQQQQQSQISRIQSLIFILYQSFGLIQERQNITQPSISISLNPMIRKRRHKRLRRMRKLKN